MALAAPHLPAHHPQNVPLSGWTDGWLTMSVAGHTDVAYIVCNDAEKKARGWPITRDEKIALLVDRGDVPAAGVDGLA
jgi:hypothetical protein